MSYLGVKGHITFFSIRSVTLEPLEGFRRNLTQMFTRLGRCAEAMCRMAGFKVKVILRGQRSNDFFPFRFKENYGLWIGESVEVGGRTASLTICIKVLFSSNITFSLVNRFTS